jgi:hypothetical protein
MKDKQASCSWRSAAPTLWVDDELKLVVMDLICTKATGSNSRCCLTEVEELWIPSKEAAAAAGTGVQAARQGVQRPPGLPLTFS